MVLEIPRKLDDGRVRSTSKLGAPQTKVRRFEGSYRKATKPDGWTSMSPTVSIDSNTRAFDAANEDRVEQDDKGRGVRRCAHHPTAFQGDGSAVEQHAAVDQVAVLIEADPTARRTIGVAKGGRSGSCFRPASNNATTADWTPVGMFRGRAAELSRAGEAAGNGDRALGPIAAPAALARPCEPKS